MLFNVFYSQVLFLNIFFKQSLVTLGAMLGGIIAGDLMFRFGRKFCELFSSIPYLVGLLVSCYCYIKGSCIKLIINKLTE